jgi:plastocyanin
MKRFFILTVWFVLLFPISILAATHDVTVGDNFFNPSDLTINVGDTVRWTYSGSMIHDVTADDLSWSSPRSSSIDYQRTFNTVEEVLYHCTVHSSPGRNLMNGRINVVGTTENPIVINSGMTDAWYNPATDGQGMLIMVWEDISFVFMAWFTFDTERPPQDVTAILGEPGHRWLTAAGPFEGDTANLSVSLTSGGVFDAAQPPAVTDPEPVGTVSVQWTDCNAATLTYDLPSLGLTGDVPIERIVAENIPLCEAGQMMQ